jgi:hypothetical protein
MNPLAWPRAHQIALVLGAILGAVIMVVVGLMYRGVNYGILTSESGLVWSASAIRWAILGAVLGGGIIYVQRLLQTK